ncbi:hypothetical protein PHISCL_05994 [Aspergillus sclerotialis]|uniref:Uncharacterized protein n=1 Tax=Aspergillus sclerotialis TaxID=2070753 RepID=A0A3A2ZQS0_9EURO|nr:hypothetical protein PHISCL_05994 [Aspergillus sclerotialis]
MDDTFSALDSRTERNVIRRLFGIGGILRGEDLIPYADLIILLNQEGSIKAQGTPQQLAIDGSFSTKNIASETLYGYMEIEPYHPGKLPGHALERTTGGKQDQMVQFPKPSVYRSYFRSSGLWNGVLLLSFLVLQSVFSKVPNVWLLRWLDTDANEMGRLYAENIGIYTLFQCLGLLFTVLAA